jgi:hypothetical protein
VAGRGGLVFADEWCKGVAFSNSVFASNAAAAGAVAYLDGWTTSKGVSAAPVSPNCTFANNVASAWGGGAAVAATGVDAAAVTLSAVQLSSGSAVSANFTLYDGAATVRALLSAERICNEMNSCIMAQRAHARDDSADKLELSDRVTSSPLAM